MYSYDSEALVTIALFVFGMWKTRHNLTCCLGQVVFYYYHVS
jgi:hypothetical protein